MSAAPPQTSGLTGIQISELAHEAVLIEENIQFLYPAVNMFIPAGVFLPGSLWD